MIVADIGGVICKIHNGKWTSTDEEMTRLLDAMERYFRREVFAGSDADPDLTSAQYMVGELGGQVVDVSEHSVPASEPDALH